MIMMMMMLANHIFLLHVWKNEWIERFMPRFFRRYDNVYYSPFLWGDFIPDYVDSIRFWQINTWLLYANFIFIFHSFHIHMHKHRHCKRWFLRYDDDDDDWDRIWWLNILFVHLYHDDDGLMQMIIITGCCCLLSISFWFPFSIHVDDDDDDGNCWKFTKNKKKIREKKNVFWIFFLLIEFKDLVILFFFSMNDDYDLRCWWYHKLFVYIGIRLWFPLLLWSLWSFWIEWNDV